MTDHPSDGSPKIRRIGRFRNIFSPFLASAALLASPGLAQGAVECSVSQVTSIAGSDSTGAVLSTGSPWMTFNVGPEFVGASGGLLEVYAAHRTSGDIINLTETAGFDGGATISGDGQLVVFESTSSLADPNPEGNRELVLLDRTSDTFLPITDSTEQNFQPQISTDGSRILFASTNDYTGENALGMDQYFEYDVAGGTFDQLSQFNDFSIGFRMDPTATWLVFASAEDLTGDNADGNDEVFLLDVASEQVTQITSTATGGSTGLGVSVDGDTIVLFSTAEELLGPNPDGLPELFVYHRSAAVFEQLTFDTSPNASNAVISGDGRRVAALIQDTITLWDLPSQTSTVLTFSPFPSVPDVTSINFDGSVVAFHVDDDLTGGNPDFNIEVFLADCPILQIFGDGFESGSTDAWSSAVGGRF